MGLGRAVDDGVLDAATAERLARARAGVDVSRGLRLDRLEVGASGVVEALVRHAEPVRTFARKRGGEGLLCRIRLADLRGGVGAGEVDLVLWDDQTHWVRDGTLVPGAAIRLRGPTVKAGWRGGVELHLGSAVLERVEVPKEEGVCLEGLLQEIADTQVVGIPPDARFHAEAILDTGEGEVQVVLWDEALKAARAVLPGARVRVDGAAPHPLLEGWFVVDSGFGARLRIL